MPPTDSSSSRSSVRLLREIAAHPALAVDLEAGPSHLRLAAAARASPRGDIVLLTSDLSQLDLATNLVANLADVGVSHYLMITPRPLCLSISSRLACVFTSLMHPFEKRLTEANTNSVRTYWLCRQIYAGRLALLGFNTMVLDADVVLFRDPFHLIHTHLSEYSAIFLSDRSAGAMCANGGTVYIRGGGMGGFAMRVWANFERRVFSLLNTTTAFPHQVMHKMPSGRIMGAANLPADGLLYDQNILDWCVSQSCSRAWHARVRTMRSLAWNSSTHAYQVTEP